MPQLDFTSILKAWIIFEAGHQYLFSTCHYELNSNITTLEGRAMTQFPNFLANKSYILPCIKHLSYAHISTQMCRLAAVYNAGYLALCCSEALIRHMVLMLHALLWLRYVPGTPRRGTLLGNVLL